MFSIEVIESMSVQESQFTIPVFWGTDPPLSASERAAGAASKTASHVVLVNRSGEQISVSFVRE